jgi:Ca-activated chloride channel family protein
MLEAFHFLRPSWLLAIVPAVFLSVCIWRRQGASMQWRRVIAPHLLPHLRVGPESAKRIRPVSLLLLAWIIGSICLAGPSWQREPSPFADETAALVIAMEVTPSMTARDVQPSRLERAAHKVKDLLALRPGAKTGLVAYAGSAHRVMPLTRDARIIEVFAAELLPEVMPLEGDAAQKAIELAAGELAAAGVPGSILWITDGVPSDAIRDLAVGVPVHILAVGTGPGSAVTPAGGPPAPALDLEALASVASALNGSFTLVTPDDRDVRRVAARVESALVASAQPGGGERWRDAGYWLVPVLVLLSLAWFRPGWTVAYS